MATKTRIKFNATKFSNALFDVLKEEQTARFIAYAKHKIIEIGTRVGEYHSRNGMDRTGNLLNSLCWGVTYNGVLKGSGFFRDAIIHSRRGKNGGSISWLHEFFANTDEVVNGRMLAEQYINTFVNKHTGKGWYVFFAILAPYWGYWESGFRMKSGGGNSGIPRSTQFLQFSVMSQFFDRVRMDLTPTKVDISVYIPKYSYKNPRYKNKVGYKKYY